MSADGAVQSAINTGLGFVVNNGSFGWDPHKGVGKSMRVTYTPPGGNAEKTKTFGENTTFTPASLLS
jgi:hypothetical protein